MRENGLFPVENLSKRRLEIVSIVQQLLQAILNRAMQSLDNTVALWVICTGKMVFNITFISELFEFSTYESGAVVRNNYKIFFKQSTTDLASLERTGIANGNREA